MKRHAALIVIVSAIGGSLFAIDLALAKMERAEIRGEADTHYSDGVRLLQAGNSAEAVEKLRRAHVLERTNVTYELELAAALIGRKSYAEAESTVNDVLDSEPDNGRANLLAARIMVQTNRFPEAESYYHRAIYGAWTDYAKARRIEARLELISALQSRAAHDELLSELLPLESEAQGDPALLKRIADLFVQSGSPQRAATVYRQLIAKNPGDGSLDEGLGQAELAAGDFRAAHLAFLTAFNHRIGNPEILQEMDLANRLAALDPTPRNLRSAEKYRRSVRILQMALNEAAACPSIPSAATGQKPEAAGASVANEVAEEKLALAQKIWKACPPEPSFQANELRLIMQKLEQ